MRFFHKPLSYFFILAGFFSLIMFGHTMAIYSYFGGPPPTADFERGQVVLTISSLTALFTCIFTIFIIQMDFESFIITILINILFLLAIITSIIALYSYRNSSPDISKFKEYTIKYYAKNQRPPAFLDSIQLRMNGFCCGAQGYEDYIVDHSSDYFDVPSSCCFTALRENDSRTCGRRKWKYLYLFLSSIMREALNVVEKEYKDLNDLGQVQYRLSKQRAQEFITSHLRDMYNDRVSTIFNHWNDTKETDVDGDANSYRKIQAEEVAKLPSRATAEDLQAKITDRVYSEAQTQIQKLQQQIVRSMSITFVPIGCWTLMGEMSSSTWKGFQQFQILRNKITGIFQGVLGMSIIHFILILVSVGVLNFHMISTLRSPSSDGGKKPEDENNAGDKSNKNQSQTRRTSRNSLIETDGEIELESPKQEIEKAKETEPETAEEDTEDEELKKLISHSNSKTNLAKAKTSNANFKSTTKGQNYQSLMADTEESDVSFP